MNSQDWIIQESSIFAVGAISSGCHMFMGDMMNLLYPFLLNLIQTTENAPLFSIASWTIHQFSDWIFNNLSEQQLDELMNILLQKMYDGNRKIQNASIGCISVLIENSEDKLICYFDSIIRTICQRFNFYCVFHYFFFYSLLGKESTFFIMLHR